MKKAKLFWGIMFISIAVLLILNIFGVTFWLPETIPAWKLFVGLLLLGVSVDSVFRRRIYLIFFPLAFILIIFEKELAELMGFGSGNIASIWTFLTIAGLLTIGFLLILPKKMKIRPSEMGTSIRYIDASVPFNERITNNLSSCEVYFTNTDRYLNNGTVTIDNNMSSLVINIPRDWYVVPTVENTMGSVNIPKRNDSEGAKRLDIRGTNNMGAVTVKYVK